jgi:hypothetical protein
MSPRLLNVFVCHNLPWYFRNTFESFREFFTVGDVLIVDNASTDPELKAYLKSIEGSCSNATVVYRDENRNAVHKVGSLYEANNLAIEHALKHGYEFINFIQDDVQFMWKDEALMEKLDRIFALDSHILNVSILFQKATEPDLRTRYDIHPAGLSYESRDYGAGDNGFFRLDRIAQTGFRFQNIEAQHSAAAFEKGSRVHLMRDPLVTYVPWPPTRRGGKLVGKERPPVGKYYLHPLSSGAVETLTGRPIEKFPIADDYCKPWGFALLAPYWFSTPGLEYVERLTKCSKFPYFIDETGRTFSALTKRHEPSLRLLVGRSLSELFWLTASRVKRFFK